jgi:galactokinase
MNSAQLSKYVLEGQLDDILVRVYGRDALDKTKQRILSLCERYIFAFDPQCEVVLVSAPGRTEIGGNHTDHQRGRVLAAAIDMDVLVLAGKNDTSIARVRSDGYLIKDVDLQETSVQADEIHTSEALIRGVSSKFMAAGYASGGFDAMIHSNVLQGSGLSSSASFEVALASVLNHLFNQASIDMPTIAKIGQSAENEYFKKPCGLMDQMTSAVGGFVAIDFFDESLPEVQKIDFAFERSGYTLCIIDTGESHADLSDEYAAMPREMKSIANYFDKEVLSEVDPNRFFADINSLRKCAGDRAVLRALHFFQETDRVLEEIDTLTSGDFAAFLELVVDSGRSSYMYLQNVLKPGSVTEQGLGLALALSESYLKGRGAWRVHGGGLAGTIQAIVKNEDLAGYRRLMEDTFGQGSCHSLKIRKDGAIRII